MLLFAKNALADLTSAVLYRPDAQPYYPIASCSGAKKLTAFHVTAVAAASIRLPQARLGGCLREMAASRRMKPKRTILCVDEDERSLSVHKVMLETRGYRVVACSNSDLAVQAMKAGGIDLVLADLPLPKADGSRLVDQLKAISPATPAIVFKGASGASADGMLADILVSRSSCNAAQLLDHVRLALVRKRGPKPSMTRGNISQSFTPPLPRHSA
jgi:two-component system, OmpR family, response regulator CpxR